MTWLLVALLVLCFVLAPVGWALHPTDPSGPELVLHLLVHKDWEHLGANAVTLLGFGWWFERHRGAPETLLLFASGGAVAAVVEVASDPGFPGAILGASGAVAAFLGAFGRLERWAWIVVVPTLGTFTWGVLDGAPNHANYAHLAGFAWGLLWVLLVPHRDDQDSGNRVRVSTEDVQRLN